MMLRTLPARSGFLWVLLACIFLAGCTRHPKYSLQTEAALGRLDAELSRKDRYQQWRQAQNDSLRREVAPMDTDRFAAPDMQEAERLVADGLLAAAAGTLQ